MFGHVRHQSAPLLIFFRKKNLSGNLLFQTPSPRPSTSWENKPNRSQYIWERKSFTGFTN